MNATEILDHKADLLASTETGTTNERAGFATSPSRASAAKCGSSAARLARHLSRSANTKGRPVMADRLDELEALANECRFAVGNTQRLAQLALEAVGEVRHLRADRDRADEALGLAVNLLAENEVERNRLRAEAAKWEGRARAIAESGSIQQLNSLTADNSRLRAEVETLKRAVSRVKDLRSEGETVPTAWILDAINDA